jgi:hypothetical protein
VQNGDPRTKPWSLADRFPLLLCHRGVDPHHHVVRAGHFGDLGRVALLQQTGEGVGAPSAAFEASGDQHRPKLATAGQRCPKARPAIVLAAGHVLVLGDQRPALRLDVGPHARLLRLQSEATVALFSGRDPQVTDREPSGPVKQLRPYQPASAKR